MVRIVTTVVLFPINGTGKVRMAKPTKHNVLQILRAVDLVMLHLSNEL